MFEHSDFDAERRLFKRAERIMVAAWVFGCICLMVALIGGGFVIWRLLVHFGIF